MPGPACPFHPLKDLLILNKFSHQVLHGMLNMISSLHKPLQCSPIKLLLPMALVIYESPYTSSKHSFTAESNGGQQLKECLAFDDLSNHAKACPL